MAKTCLIIKFEHESGNFLVEYAALKEEEPGIDTILSGSLYTSDKQEIDNSRVSVTLLGEDQDAQVFMSLHNLFNLDTLQHTKIFSDHDFWFRGNR